MDLNDMSDDFGLEDEAIEEGVVQQTPKVILEEEDEDQGEIETETNSQHKKQSLEEQVGDDCVEVEKSEVLCSAPSSPQQFSRGGYHKPQPPIQSGATFPLSSDPRFLTYNLEGQIVQHPNDDQKVIAASSHNPLRRKIPLITDMYDFEIGALSSEGLVLASRGEGDKPPVIMVNLFESWDSNANWMMTLEEQEQPMCVAIGGCFIAIGVRNRTVHIFEMTGHVIKVLGLPGDVVALAAFEDTLAVVTHKGAPANFRDQSLSLQMYSIQKRSKICDQELVLSPESKLQWIDFSEEGQLCTMDTEGIVWMFNNDFGQSWCPVFDSALERKDQEIFWPAGIKQRKLACIICTTEQKYPKVNPKPFLEMISLKIPVLTQAGDIANLESENLLCLQELASCSFLDEEVAKLKTERSKNLCKLFYANIKAEKLRRAYDVARQMNQEKELQVVLNMAQKSNRSSLVTRIEQLIQDLKDAQFEVEDRTPLSICNFTTPVPSSRTGSKRKYQKIENPFTRSTPKH